MSFLKSKSLGRAVTILVLVGRFNPDRALVIGGLAPWADRSPDLQESKCPSHELARVLFELRVVIPEPDGEQSSVDRLA